MNESDIRRLIKKEIEIALQVITSGSAGSNTGTTESINELFAGLPTLPDRPIMRPYGFTSRAPSGTISVTAQQGSHPGNKLTLGHRDASPPDVAVGESAIYNLAGYIIKIESGKIQVGKSGEFEPLVVGDTLNDFLIAMMELIIAHTHLGNLGTPTGPPMNAAQFTTLKTENLDNEMLLTKDGGRF